LFPISKVWDKKIESRLLWNLDWNKMWSKYTVWIVVGNGAIKIWRCYQTFFVVIIELSDLPQMSLQFNKFHDWDVRSLIGWVWIGIFMMKTKYINRKKKNQILVLMKTMKFLILMNEVNFEIENWVTFLTISLLHIFCC